MSSYISHFKAWIGSAVIFAAIEAAVYLVASPSIFDRTNFLQFSFVHDETPQRLFVLEKIKAFANSNPTIVQSGDSSGFYGIDPRVVTRHLPTGTSYINSHQETGLVIPPDDPAALREAMRTLYDNPDRAAEMGQKAYQRYLKHFTASQMVDRYIDLYREVLAKDRP